VLFICRREKSADVISDSFSHLIHFAMRRYQSGGSSRLSSSALSLLAACALRKTKKSTGIVIPPVEIRELLPEGSCRRKELHAIPERASELKFAVGGPCLRPSSYRPFSSSCPRLHLASSYFFLHFRLARDITFVISGTNLPLHHDLLIQIGISRLTRDAVSKVGRVDLNFKN